MKGSTRKGKILHDYEKKNKSLYSSTTCSSSIGASPVQRLAVHSGANRRRRKSRQRKGRERARSKMTGIEGSTPTAEDDGEIPLLPKTIISISHRRRYSFAGAVFNLSTNIVGAGIMALPACAKVLGVVPAIAMILLVAFFTDAAIELLLRFSRAGKTNTYAGVMEDSFGRPGRILLQVSVIVKAIGVMIIYMIIVGK